MAGRRKIAPALALAALLVVGVTACGGGRGSTTVSSAPGGSVSTEPSPAESGSGKAGRTEEGSASFIVPGGDNSVQEFGREAPASEREAASRVITSYMRARSSHGWSVECATLSRSALEPLESLAASSAKLKGADCPTLLAALAGNRVAPANTMTGPIGSLRVQGNRGFALYHGTHGTDYAVSMQREGAIWKVATLEPVPLN